MNDYPCRRAASFGFPATALVLGLVALPSFLDAAPLTADARQVAREDLRCCVVSQVAS